MAMSIVIMFALLGLALSSGEGHLMRLFSAEPPDSVEVPGLRSALQPLIYNVTRRLLCEEHGLHITDCTKCLDTDHVIHLLRLDPSSDTFNREDAEDLAVWFAYHILYLESACSAKPAGCQDFQKCQEEVLHSIGTFSSLSEPLVRILRIFKLVLRGGENKPCFGAEQILEDLPSDNARRTPKESMRQVFRLLMGHILQGECIEADASTSDFLDDIFHHYGDSCSPFMTLNGLKRMMHDLQSASHGHTHKGDHHHSHHQHPHHHDHEGDHHHCNGLFAIYHSHNHEHPSDNQGGMNGARNHHGHDHDHNHSDHDHDHSDHDHDHSDHDHDHSAEDHQNHSPKYERLQHVHHDHQNGIGYHDHHEHVGTSMNDSAHIGNQTNQNGEVDFHPTTTTSKNIDFNATEENVYTSLHNPGWTRAENATAGDTVTESVLYMQASSIDSLPSEEYRLSRAMLSLLERDVRMGSGLARFRRSTPDHNSHIELDSDAVSGPFSSLKSDLSHPEEVPDHDHPQTVPSDDVKKVYLLSNEDASQNANIAGNNDVFPVASMASKCLSVEDLMYKFGHDANSSLSKADFVEFCPALIQQIVSGVCGDPVPPPSPLPSRMEVYGYGSLSVFIISLTSLAGVLLLPVMTKHAYNYIIAGFYGLAFSTLAGDALLHLIPQFLGLHSHGGGDDGHDHSHSGSFLEPYVQLQLGVFFTIYGLFLFEAILCAFSKGDHHSKHQDSKGHGHSHVHISDEIPTLISVKTKSETHLPVSRDQSTSSLDTEIVDMDSMKKPPNLMVSQPVVFGLTTMALVVTLGDSIHNFGDGLAIGAAFSTGIRGGLSTAIAVFCHELPHEFGDFVVLLSTGLSFSKALWLNFLSGLTCFAGLYIGIYIGDNEIARQWVMAVTAGIFLYVALGEMIPELREHSRGSPAKMLLIKNLGILGGIGIMLIISIYEHEIV